jgi:hypothetical protein
MLREITGLQRAPEFEGWLLRHQISDLHGRLLDQGAAQPLISGLQALTGAQEQP